VLGNGPRQAIGLRTWIQKCKYELDLSDVVRCATHFASGKISTDADKDRKVEPNQPGELEAVRTHERIAPLTRSSPCEDYRIKGRDRLRTMTLDAAEFIRRFLLHVLPNGFHRIRHYGLFAGTVRARNIERVRQLLAAPEASPERSRNAADSEAERPSPLRQCPGCGGRMIIVETFEGARSSRSPSPSRIRIDTS
jgi:Putative transposase